MKKRTREKVALLVFALLVILGGSVLLRYFETGRSWNVAASVVDDAFGQMQGYTAIVYDGTYDPLDALRPAMAPAQEGGPPIRVGGPTHEPTPPSGPPGDISWVK